MKTLQNSTTISDTLQAGLSAYNYAHGTKNVSVNSFSRHTLESAITRESLLTPKTNGQMALGMLPDLWDVCLDLFATFFTNEAPYSALQFVPVLKALQLIDEEQIRRFINNPETNHVLIQNDLLKVVLIHWKPGKISSIHGHPSGGCVFKVLRGQLEELRYTTDSSPELLSSSTYLAGSMAYIDDKMGYHAVGNPFNSPALSLHAYTPGIKK